MKETATTKRPTHTAGPWEVLFGGLEGDTSFTIASKVDPGSVCDYGVAAPRPSAEVNANARLIAAAPDLLAACKAAVSHIDGDPIGPGTYKAILAAIAKAEGRDA